jgi:hypothetical protein
VGTGRYRKSTGLLAQGPGKVDDRPVCPIDFGVPCPLLTSGTRCSRWPIEPDSRAGIATLPGPCLLAVGERRRARGDLGPQITSAEDGTRRLAFFRDLIVRDRTPGGSGHLYATTAWPGHWRPLASMSHRTTHLMPVTQQASRSWAKTMLQALHRPERTSNLSALSVWPKEDHA